MAIVQIKAQQAPPPRGKLVRVPFGRKGTSILMYESEARARGLLPPEPEAEQKMLPARRNKKRAAAENKAA